MVLIRAKTWIFWAQAIVSGALSLFGLIFGPLALAGIIKPAHGGSGDPAGIALTLWGTILLPVFALAVFNIAARRAPLIMCNDDCVEFNLIGASTLDGIPLIPRGIRLVWRIVSGQGFRTQRFRVPVHAITDVATIGLPMSKVLVIQINDDTTESPRDLREIRFMEVAFAEPIDSVAEKLREYVFRRA